MDNIWDDDDPDEIFISDDDLSEVYNYAMEFPLLDRLINGNNTNERIVTITQPCTQTIDNNTVKKEEKDKTPNQVKIKEIVDKITELSIQMSIQKNELEWFIIAKQEMQQEIDRLYRELADTRASVCKHPCTNTCKRYPLSIQDELLEDTSEVATPTQGSFRAPPIPVLAPLSSTHTLPRGQRVPHEHPVPSTSAHSPLSLHQQDKPESTNCSFSLDPSYMNMLMLLTLTLTLFHTLLMIFVH